jgi:glycerol-3-phosphate dehydrogenase
LVRGSHIILPRLNRSDNAIAHFGADGRIVFFIPWGSRDHLTLVGTTDVDHDGSPDEVAISAQETRYLRDVAAQVFPESKAMEPLAAYSSLRPLLQKNTGSATAATREHQIWRTPEGVTHVTGGKYTTYRVMAEEAADLAVAPVAPGLARVHETARHALNGNTPERVKALLAAATSGEQRHLVKDYGVRAPHLMERAAALGSVEAARREEAREREWMEREEDFRYVSSYAGHEGVS